MTLNRRIKSSLGGVFVATAALFGAANLAHSGMYKDASIIDLAEKKGEFSMFLKAVDAADLQDTLENAKDVTVFLPSDDAFEALPEDTLNELLSPEGKDKLKDILSYHVVTEELKAADISAGLENSETLLGQPVSFSESEGTKMINEASVVTADLSAKNAVVHVIDKVLIPSDS